MAKARGVIEWLLGEGQPSIRYLTLTTLLGKSEQDPDVREAKAKIPSAGWAADILAKRAPEGWWVHETSLYTPKYVSTNWMLLVLSDLGLTREDPRIRESCEIWIHRFSMKDGGFNSDGSKSSHLCLVGNTARALIRFGYVDHPQVRSSFEWLVENQAKLGGWSCFMGGRNLDSWEGMSAFAAYPRQRWTRAMEEAVEKAAEFYLQRELHKQGDPYAPWYRFHYPVHYYYDVLVGLDFMTALGYGDDPRMEYPISLLKEKRRRDGRWILDAVHPDVEGGMAEWYARRPKNRPTPFALETPGEPSKMITLRALQILSRLGEGP